MDRAHLIAEGQVAVEDDRELRLDSRPRTKLGRFVPKSSPAPRRRGAEFVALAWLSCALALAFTVVSRPLWFDEILGHLMCRLSWPGEVLRASDAGVDLSPPGWFLLVRLSEDVMGGSDRGPRWLALAGVALAAWIVHRLASERWGAAAGHASAAALLLTGAREFAFEGRPYGVLLGLAALALFAWQRASDTPRRATWIAVLALALASSVLVHYYGVLLWVPLAMGEIVKRFRRGVWDWPILVVLAASLLPLLPLIPHAMRGGEVMKLAPFSEPGFNHLGKHYRFLLDTLRIPLIVLALACLFRKGLWGTLRQLRPWIRSPLAVAVTMLLVAPGYAMIVAALGSGISHPRYTLPTTLGVSLLAGFLVHELRIAPVSRRFLANVLLLIAVYASASKAFHSWVDAKSEFQDVARSAPVDLPIVVNHPIGGLEAWYNADDALRQRMVIAADAGCAVQSDDPATADLNLTGMRGFFPIQIASWAEIRAEHPRFVLMAPWRVRYWLKERVDDSAEEQTLLASSGGWDAWRVEMCSGSR